MTPVKDMDKSVRAAMQYVAAIAEAIRDLNEVPSGHLYAQVMSHINLESYNRVIKILTDAKMIKVSNHLITWIGPKKDEARTFEDGRMR